MEDPSKIYRILIKFMDEKYIDSFLDEGLIYMNNIDFFRNYEKEEDGKSVRGDPAEGLAMSLKAEDLQVSFNGQILEGLVGKVEARFNHEDKTNIYSMTRISDKDILDAGSGGLYISEEFLKFGNKAVIISGDNINKFCDKLNSALNSDDDVFTYREDGCITKQVDYVDRDQFHGDMGVFTKFCEYSWQYEWRIAFKQRKSSGEYVVKLGSLRDIVTIAETKSLVEQPIKLIHRENI